MRAINQAIIQFEEMPGAGRFASLYPSLNNVDAAALAPATAADLAEVVHLRFDAVSACNARCVFCHSDFDAPVRQLALEQLSAVLDHPMPKLNTLAIGCAFEPLIGKLFERYPEVMARYRGQAQARIVTNAYLLDKRDIGPWVDFGLEYLHVSLHSHIPEVYERTMQGAVRLPRVVSNLAEARRRFPGLRLLLINVVTKANNRDLAGYCRWGFEELGADQIVLWRAEIATQPLPGSPAFHSPEIALSDDEWAEVLRACAPFSDDPAYTRLPALGKTISSMTLSRQTQRALHV